jgi:uncharacterized membrane protein YhaH (DUF805 family)
MEWMILPLKRYADFSGRSSRMEYWMFALLQLIIVVALALVFLVIGGSSAAFDAGGDPSAMFGGSVVILALVYLAVFLVPSIAVAVRRWHDMDKTGWMVLLFAVLGAIPVVGFLASIANIVFMCLAGTSGPNQYGDDPLGRSHTVI